MDEHFGEAYEALFDNFQVSSESATALREGRMPAISNILRQVINEADDVEFGQGHRRLRSDGKFFLLSNFYSMIFMPLFLGNRGIVDFKELISAMRADIFDIVGQAGELAPGREISGHDVLESVNRRWGFLRTMQLRVWGDE